LSNQPPPDPLQPFNPPQPYRSPSQPDEPQPDNPVPPAGPVPTSGPMPPAGPYPPTSQFPAQPGYPAQSGYPHQPEFDAPEYAPDPAYGPPHGYAPPGSGTMQAGYGPPEPGYGPPGYGPPPRPPKRSNAPLIALVLAVTVLLCGGAVTATVLVVNNVTDRAKKAIEPITNPTLPTVAPTVPTDLPDLPGLPTDLPTDLPNLPNLPGNSGKKITVVYEVTGDGPAEIVYTEKLGDSPKRVSNAKLPWKVKTTMQGTALISVTAVRSATDAGTISCRAMVDGEEVAQRTREGTFATASCTKVVLD
jgi:hypothetical protein